MSGPAGAEGGALERDRDLGRILDDAWGLLRRHLGRALLLAALVVVPVELLVSGVGLGNLTGGYEASPSGEEVAFGSLVSLLVTTPLVTGMLLHLVLADERGEEPSVGAAAEAGFNDFGPLLLAIVLYTLGILVGLVAFIIPGIFLAIRWALVSPAVVVERRRGPEALRRSWDLVTGHSWWTLGVLIVQGLLLAIVGGIVALPLDAAAESADAQAIAVAGGILSQILTLPFAAFVTAVLFFTLRAREAGIGPEGRAGQGGGGAGGFAPPGDAPERVTGPAWTGPGEPAPPAAPEAERPLWGGSREEPEDGEGGRPDDPPAGPAGWEPPVPPR